VPRGEKYELTEQFRDVQKLSKRVEKPVLHLSLRLAPGETLSRNQLIEIGREAAKEFGVADHPAKEKAPRKITLTLKEVKSWLLLKK
jgi:hypothetical protein